MKSRIGILLCGVMTVTLAVAAPVSSPQAGMASTKRWGDRTPATRPGVRSLIPQPQETFSVAVNYSGFLNTDLLIEGVTYRPDPAMFVYAVGQGLVPSGSSVANQSILVSGDQAGRPVHHPGDHRVAPRNHAGRH